MTTLLEKKFDVRTATIIPLPAKHEPCFTDANVNAISQFLIMEACIAINHTLLIAKSPTPSKAQYELSLSMIRRSIVKLPFHKKRDESLLWVYGLCEPFYYHGVEEQMPKLLWEETEVEEAYLPARGFGASFFFYAKRLTAQLGKILYALPKEELRERLVLPVKMYEDMILQPYLRYLSWALPLFEEALCTEAYTLTAYPFAISAMGAGAERAADDEKDDTKDDGVEGCEIICTEFVPTITLYHVWNAAKEMMEEHLFENGVFTPFADFGMDSIVSPIFGKCSENSIFSQEMQDDEEIAFPYDTYNSAYFDMLIDLFAENVDEEGGRLMSDIYGDGSAACAALYDEEEPEDSTESLFGLFDTDFEDAEPFDEDEEEDDEDDEDVYDAQVNTEIAAILSEDFNEESSDNGDWLNELFE